MVLAINSQVPAKTLKEFIDYAKANPGKLNYGSPGSGSVGHLVAALFVARAGIDIMHVPYKGGGPAMADLIGQIGHFCDAFNKGKRKKLRKI
jgi:tripartite-type tricarboxylate transporter receptor subunit TctC